MDTALRKDDFLTPEKPLINPQWKDQPMYSHEEFWNIAYADLGKRYGLKDIRDAK